MFFSTSVEEDFIERWELVYKGRRGGVQGSWAQVAKGLGRPAKQGDELLETWQGASDGAATRSSSEELPLGVAIESMQVKIFENQVQIAEDSMEGAIK